jgi:hypothetical protein
MVTTECAGNIDIVCPECHYGVISELKEQLQYANDRVSNMLTELHLLRDPEGINWKDVSEHRMSYILSQSSEIAKLKERLSERNTQRSQSNGRLQSDRGI